MVMLNISLDPGSWRILCGGCGKKSMWMDEHTTPQGASGPPEIWIVCSTCGTRVSNLDEPTWDHAVTVS